MLKRGLGFDPGGLEVKIARSAHARDLGCGQPIANGTLLSSKFRDGCDILAQGNAELVRAERRELLRRERIAERRHLAVLRVFFIPHRAIGRRRCGLTALSRLSRNITSTSYLSRTATRTKKGFLRRRL